MSVRTRFALLYAVAFLVLGLLVVASMALEVKQTQHVGSPSPPVTSYPLRAQAGALAMAVVVLVLLAVGIGWLLAGRMLRPVRMIAATAQDISATNLSRRLRVGRRDDEFTRLGRTLNDLFARLEAAFTAQRHFIANASHELRTPVAAERTVLQVALADPEASVATLREACEEVLRLGERQEKLIGALLTLASSERGLEVAEPVDLAAVARDVSAGTGIIPVLCPILGPARAAGDPRLIRSLVTNLVENAVRHNTEAGWVYLETSTADGRAVLRVSNSGPVVPPAEVDRLFRPFQRLGAERVPGAGAHGHGHGLGLAIVRAIADAHNASVLASARPDGGLDIEVRFPPA
jgi:signal transduction histidine kinase